jgi:hypothetical protein
VASITSAIIGLDTETIPENCNINFIFPGDINVLQPLICYKNLINTCSESDYFRVPEGINVSKDDIRKLCTNSGIVSPYRVKSMYANVFCHICNGEFFHQKTKCTKYTGSMFSKIKLVPQGFTALIDVRFITGTRLVGRDKVPIACSYNNVSCFIKGISDYNMSTIVFK